MIVATLSVGVAYVSFAFAPFCCDLRCFAFALLFAFLSMALRMSSLRLCVSDGGGWDSP